MLTHQRDFNNAENGFQSDVNNMLIISEKAGPIDQEDIVEDEYDDVPFHYEIHLEQRDAQ